MDNKLNQSDWDLLLSRIKNGRCTPFLGAGVCAKVLPLSSEIAEEWARELGFPLDDCTDLAHVAQFLAVKFGDAMHPKDLLVDRFNAVIDKLKEAQSSEFEDPYEPHRVLADLPMPIYITTNYDNFMIEALAKRGKKPVQEVCRWYEHFDRTRRKKTPTVFKPGAKITEQNPVVYHLHGHIGARESIVLTEDDYLDFLVSVSEDKAIVPPRIQQAMTGTTLLFLGYSLNDWDFRVLFRSLVSYLPHNIGLAHISVQLVPVKNTAPEEQKQKAQEYLHRYFDKRSIHVYWGTCQDFARELKDRWEKYNGR